MKTVVQRETAPELSISSENVRFIVVKARELGAKDVPTVSDDGSSPIDDGMIAVLEDRKDDPVHQELTDFISALSEDERVDLVTLVWLGRGDGGVEDWKRLRSEAARMHNQRTAPYLLGLPFLSDFLEEGSVQCGR